MVDLGNASEIMKVSFELMEIAQVLNQAVSNHLLVQLRIEDRPEMDIDAELSTSIVKAGIDEEMKCLAIQADGFDLKFKYDTFGLGTESASHKKFYFESEGVTLTVVVYY